MSAADGSPMPSLGWRLLALAWALLACGIWEVIHEKEGDDDGEP